MTCLMVGVEADFRIGLDCATVVLVCEVVIVAEPFDDGRVDEWRMDVENL